MKVHKSPQEFQDTIEGYKQLIKILRDAQKQIYYWKNFWYESQSKENLLQGYKKVIQQLSDKLRRKDS